MGQPSSSIAFGDTVLRVIVRRYNDEGRLAVRRTSQPCEPSGRRFGAACRFPFC
jgi:hypothetical protein